MSENPIMQSEWNAFVLANGGGFLQSEEWAMFQESLGRKVWRLKEDVDGQAVARGLFVRMPLPFGRSFLYAPRGPVIAGGVSKGEFVRRFDVAITAMLAEARSAGDAFVRIEPEWAVETAPFGAGDLAERGFRAAAHVQPDHTRLVDLAHAEEKLLAGMHQKTRYNIKVAERHGVTVRECDPAGADFAKDVESFLGLMRLTTARDGFSAHADAYYAKMLEVLGERKDGGLSVRLWLAELNGVAVASAIVGTFGSTAIYLHGASDAEKRQAMGPFVLHWRIMQAVKAAGATVYDLWGTAPTDDAEHPWAGITRFKNGFGGVSRAYVGAWELPGRRFWYTVYRSVKAVRKLVSRR
jgi:peptidoglycan pentaglycine glycine transferase (the first glycine)